MARILALDLKAPIRNTEQPKVVTQDPLDAALASSAPQSMAVLPSSQGRATVLEIHRPSDRADVGGPAAATKKIPVVYVSEQPKEYVPTGFLGLDDTPVFDANAEPPKPKSRWGRFIDALTRQ